MKYVASLTDIEAMPCEHHPAEGGHKLTNSRRGVVCAYCLCREPVLRDEAEKAQATR